MGKDRDLPIKPCGPWIEFIARVENSRDTTRVYYPWLGLWAESFGENMHVKMNGLGDPSFLRQTVIL